MEKIDFKSSLQIIEECYENDPSNNEVIDRYLELKMDMISFSIHEWPYGILFGNNFATKEECELILEDIPLLYKLDRNKKHSEYINDYENKVKEYMIRLESEEDIDPILGCLEKGCYQGKPVSDEYIIKNFIKKE